ncbi:MAG: hypothetical protein QM658_10145 [Gordonia sp. (in: high G+C Gram-positive bacteria)]
MGSKGGSAREAWWSTAASVVLVIRLIATIATVVTVLVWLVAAIRNTLLNGWLCWALGSALILLASTYSYSWLRVRYPSHSDRWEQ